MPESSDATHGALQCAVGSSASPRQPEDLIVKRTVAHGTPKRCRLGKLDSLQSSLLHHLLNLPGGESLLETGAEAIQGIRAHDIEASVLVERQRKIVYLPATSLGQLS